MKMSVEQIKDEMWDLKEKELREIIDHAGDVLRELNDIRVQFLEE